MGCLKTLSLHVDPSLLSKELLQKIKISHIFILGCNTESKRKRCSYTFNFYSFPSPPKAQKLELWFYSEPIYCRWYGPLLEL